jgi:hypothetical protein
MCDQQQDIVWATKDKGWLRSWLHRGAGDEAGRCSLPGGGSIQEVLVGCSLVSLGRNRAP